MAALSYGGPSPCAATGVKEDQPFQREMPDLEPPYSL